jgi:hypothetical protein
VKPSHPHRRLTALARTFPPPCSRRTQDPVP